MPGGVGVLCAERGAKGVDVAESLGVGFCIQLAADRKACLLAEEVLRIISLSIFIHRHVLHIQRGNAEHLSRALAIASGNQRRVDIDEASLLKKFVEGVCRQRADAEHSLKGVRPRP